MASPCSSARQRRPHRAGAHRRHAHLQHRPGPGMRGAVPGAPSDGAGARSRSCRRRRSASGCAPASSTSASPTGRPGRRDLWFEPLYNEEMVLVVAAATRSRGASASAWSSCTSSALVLLPRVLRHAHAARRVLRACGAEPVVVAEMIDRSRRCSAWCCAREIGAIVASNAVPAAMSGLRDDPDRKPDADPHAGHAVAPAGAARGGGAVVRGDRAQDGAGQQPAPGGAGLSGRGARAADGELARTLALCAARELSFSATRTGHRPWPRRRDRSAHQHRHQREGPRRHRRRPVEACSPTPTRCT